MSSTPEKLQCEILSGLDRNVEKLEVEVPQNTVELQKNRMKKFRQPNFWIKINSLDLWSPPRYAETSWEVRPSNQGPK